MVTHASNPATWEAEIWNILVEASMGKKVVRLHLNM
jgi:hypothetical protein